jgi:hypothetical protein
MIAPELSPCVFLGYIEYIRYPGFIQLKIPLTKELEKILDLRKRTEPGIEKP